MNVCLIVADPLDLPLLTNNSMPKAPWPAIALLDSQLSILTKRQLEEKIHENLKKRGRSPAN